MDLEAMERAVADFLKATDLPDGEYLKETPQRVAKAWASELLAGYALDPAEALGELLPAPPPAPPLAEAPPAAPATPSASAAQSAPAGQSAPAAPAAPATPVVPAGQAAAPAPEGAQPMVVLTSIPFHSMCAHHLLPFAGRAAVGYLPARGSEAKLVGLGGLARLVEVFARRLQTQERLTLQIAEALDAALAPRGVGIAGRSPDLSHSHGVAVAVWADHACLQARGPRSPATTVTSKFTGAFASSQGMREEFWEQTRSRAHNLVGSSTDSRVEA